ncbi:hypothetical protein CMV_026798 [Castanea mollissima]|uniref:Uncharacterized protein n=1 Tax=Castanea mollissima TaxID=60419 RepID=A0A8J4V775_9ROSI|nr:hypothetical protein CMV_026798 [Castanea mollissima]
MTISATQRPLVPTSTPYQLLRHSDLFRSKPKVQHHHHHHHQKLIPSFAASSQLQTKSAATFVEAPKRARNPPDGRDLAQHHQAHRPVLAEDDPS